MKRGLLFPAAVLAAVLAFCLWNGAAMAARTDLWQGPLEEADSLAQSGDWEGAAAAIAGSYDGWSRHQTYLHCVTGHEAVDGAEAMYRRALAFAGAEEESELRAELADLRAQLRRLAEMEELSVRNVF